MHEPRQHVPVTEGVSEDQEEARSRRRRTLREALLAFLEKLKPWCDRFETLDEWWEFLRPLDRLLERYRKDLTPAQYRRLKRYVEWTETGREALGLACQGLTRELAAVARELAAAGAGVGAASSSVAAASSGGGVAWAWILAAALAVAVLIGGGVWLAGRAFPREGSTVRVESRGCAPVEPPVLTPTEREAFETLGILLPQTPLTPEHPWEFHLPPQIRTLEVEFTADALRVAVEVAAGLTWTWSLPWEAPDSTWTLDGQALVPGRPVRVALQPGDAVTLVVACR